MKDKLTAEQSEYLIRLGVSEDKASGEKELKQLPEHVLKGIPMDTDEKWGWFKCFTLSDILTLLPKEIEVYYDGETIPYQLVITPNSNGWEASYYNNEALKTTPELIDALYELLIWTIKNN